MPGVIALAGGNEFRDNCRRMDEALLALLPKPARVLILPTANNEGRPDIAIQWGVRHFESLGAKATGAMILNRQDCQDERFLPVLRDVDLIYLAGGNPRHLLDSLRDTIIWQAIHEHWMNGGMLVGSSAGAMAIVSHMRTREGGWDAALGLVPRVGVLPHHEHASAEQIARLRAALPADGVLLGIDEASACFLQEGLWRVVGPGRVTVYTPETSDTYSSGSQFSLPQTPLPRLRPQDKETV
jgi:cyanophycinase